MVSQEKFNHKNAPAITGLRTILLLLEIYYEA